MTEIVIIANGRPATAGAAETVAQFLAARSLAPAHVVVEHNGEPLPRERFAQVELHAGDRLEIAQMVGGG